jgi:hypothetical protein
MNETETLIKIIVLIFTLIIDLGFVYVGFQIIKGLDKKIDGLDKKFDTIDAIVSKNNLLLQLIRQAQNFKHTDN